MEYVSCLLPSGFEISSNDIHFSSTHFRYLVYHVWIREKQKSRPTVTPDQLLHFSKRKRGTSRTVKEELLQEVTVKAFNRILTDSDGFLRQMQENIAKAIMAADTMSPDGIQARLDELQKELIRKANSKQDYDAIADEIFRLREQKSQAEADTRSREETQKRIAELQDFIGSQQSEITEFDESLVRKLIQQITVYDDHFTVRFKAELEIDIEA